MSLHPTPTRLRRLRRVRDGQVNRYGDGHDYDHLGLRLDAAMGEMARAGWVRLGDPGPVKQPWVLSAAGFEVLERSHGR